MMQRWGKIEKWNVRLAEWCNNLELMQIQTQPQLRGHRITLALGNNEAWDDWIGSPWKTTFVHDATRGHVGVWSILLPQASRKPEIYVDVCSLSWWLVALVMPSEGLLVVIGMCSRLRTWSPWSVHPLRAMSRSLVLIRPGAVLMSVAYITPEVWCPWSGLPCLCLWIRESWPHPSPAWCGHARELACTCGSMSWPWHCSSLTEVPTIARVWGNRPALPQLSHCSPQLMAYGGDAGGKDSSSLGRLTTRNCPCSMIVWTTQNGLVGFLSFILFLFRRWRVTSEGGSHGGSKHNGCMWDSQIIKQKNVKLFLKPWKREVKALNLENRILI